MGVQLKPVEEQRIVITGASSGIGMATAKAAARRGARVVIAARNEQALMEVQNQIQEEGGQAAVVVADVGSKEDVQRIFDAAIQAFGGFDTWVNNAGISIYGKIEDVAIEDSRRLFETNFWGVVQGSLTALPHLKDNGGALINLGSIVSERAIPLQGIYSASKHAVMGFTEALRMELERDGAPVSVTLIMPGSIDTPFPQHAKAYIENEPTLPPPVYAPELVADAILHAAEHPTRRLIVGGGGKAITTMGHYAPWLTDKVMEWVMWGQSYKSKKTDPLRQDSLHRPHHPGASERGHYEGMVRKHSAYTSAEMHPLAATLLLGGVALGGLALLGTLASRGGQRSRRARSMAYGDVYGEESVEVYGEVYCEPDDVAAYAPEDQRREFTGGKGI